MTQLYFHHVDDEYDKWSGMPKADDFDEDDKQGDDAYVLFKETEGF